MEKGKQVIQLSASLNTK